MLIVLVVNLNAKGLAPFIEFVLAAFCYFPCKLHFSRKLSAVGN